MLAERPISHTVENLLSNGGEYACGWAFQNLFRFEKATL